MSNASCLDVFPPDATSTLLTATLAQLDAKQGALFNRLMLSLRGSFTNLDSPRGDR